MKKTVVALVLVVMALFTCTAYADEVVASAPEKAIEVIVNGEALEMDVAPVIVNDGTMVPLRAIFEALGAKVTWIDTDRLIIATDGDTVVIMQIDNERMIVDRTGSDDKETITLEPVPFILNDRTMVPTRAVSEAFDAEVEWDAVAKTVTVTKVN